MMVVKGIQNMFPFRFWILGLIGTPIESCSFDLIYSKMCHFFKLRFKPKVWLTGSNLFFFKNFINIALICAETLNFSKGDFVQKIF
jgi:hypothetical protein